jgi:hypothetical protein
MSIIGYGAYFWIGMMPGALLLNAFVMVGLFCSASSCFFRLERSAEEVLTAGGFLL